MSSSSDFLLRQKNHNRPNITIRPTAPRAAPIAIPVVGEDLADEEVEVVSAGVAKVLLLDAEEEVADVSGVEL